MKKKFARIWGIGLAVALLTSLMVSAVPASALTQPQVTFVAAAPVGKDNVISQVDPDYIITFTTGKQLVGNNSTDNATITISFPADTVITAGSLVATISASPGWYTNPPTAAPVWKEATLNSTNWSASYDPALGIRKISYTLWSGDLIGEGAQVRIAITAGLTNPTTAGTYTLTVGTSMSGGAIPIESPVESAPYSIVVPTVVPLPGIASLYNTAGVLMAQYTGDTAIASCMGLAADGYTIKLSPGTYSESVTVAKERLTIEATGTAEETIIGKSDGSSVITITNKAYVTLKGLTIRAAINATNATALAITNCVIKPGLFGPATLVTATNTSTTYPATLSGCTLTATGLYTSTGINVVDSGVTVTGCTITNDALSTAISTNGTLKVTGNTVITGGGLTSYGIKVNAGTATIDTTTIGSEETALQINGGTGVTLKTSTIKSSYKDAIQVTANVATTITGNTIQDTAAGTVLAPTYALRVADTATNNVTCVFNNFTGNTNNVIAGTGLITDTTVVDCTHNWWGAATGPAAGSIKGGLGLDYTPYLGAPVTTSTAVSLNSASLLYGKLYANVDVEATGYTPAIIAAATYASNPTTVAPPYTALANGYYDVYVGGGGPIGTNTVLIKLYNANITANTKVYIYSTLEGKWVKCAATAAYASANPSFLPQGINLVSGYAYVNVVVSGTVPVIGDLVGLPFVLVDEPVVPPAAPTLQSPEIGESGVAVSPTLVWSAVTGAPSYRVELSKASDFATLVEGANVTQAFYKPAKALDYSTVYYWRVKALTTPETAWSVGQFTTMAEPAAVPVIEKPAAGAVDVSITPTFVWTVVPRAIRYEFALSEDPTFKILKWSANVPINMYAAPEELKYSTTYYWRVRGVLAEPYQVGPAWVTPATAWATGIFTTMAEPVPTEIKVEQPPAPKVDVTVEPAKVTVEPSPPAIPEYMLWVIIGVGIVLFIALIVLIVRTRRVA